LVFTQNNKKECRGKFLEKKPVDITQLLEAGLEWPRFIVEVLENGSFENPTLHKLEQDLKVYKVLHGVFRLL